MNNSNAVYVKFLPPTNTLGARVQFKTYDLTSKKANTKTVSYDHAHARISEQALALFKDAGLDVVATNGRHPDYDTFLIKWDFDKLAEFFGVEVQS